MEYINMYNKVIICYIPHPKLKLLNPIKIINKNNQLGDKIMRYQLLITVCSVVFIASSAYADQDVSAEQQVDNSAGMVAEQPQRMMAAPRGLPIARDGEVIDSVGGGATEAVLPVAKTAAGVSYITGGVGDEELAEIKAQEHNFNAHVLLSSTSGEYMSEATIRFLDSSNAEILRVDDVGPFFYATLPAGTYKVEAASNSGAVQSKKLVVSDKKPSGRVVILFNE